MTEPSGITRRELFAAASAVAAAVTSMALLKSKVAGSVADASIRADATLITQAGTIVWDDGGLPAYFVDRDLHFGDMDWGTAFRAVTRQPPESGGKIPEFFQRFLDNEMEKFESGQ